MRALACALVVAAAACKAGDGSGPPPGQATRTISSDAGAPPGPALQLLRCAPALAAPHAAPAPSPAGSPGGDAGAPGGRTLARRPGQAGDERAGAAIVAIGAARVTGPMAAGAVRRVLDDNRVRLAFCYEQRLVVQPTLGGRSRLTIQIEPDGRVFEAHVEERFDDELALCVKHMVAELRFTPVARPGTSRVAVEVPLEFRLPDHATSAVAAGTSPATPAAWTPFAEDATVAGSGVAAPVAANLRRELPMARLSRCFGEYTGALRSVVRVGGDGVVLSARSGGVGVREVETCASAALVGIRLPPAEAGSEVACDFLRGDPAPWRVSVDAGYVVLDAALPQERAPEAGDRERTFLVLADRQTPASALARALERAAVGAATIVALRADSGAPVFSFASRASRGFDPSTPLTLDAGSEPVRVCGGLLDRAASAPLGEADRLLRAASTRCTRRPCPAQLTISFREPRTAGDLAALAGAARGAGFERIALGADRCPP